MQLTSPQFENGASLPATTVRQQQNQSPELVWQHLPAGTASLALVVEDPDAPKGVWSHWVIYTIDPALGTLPAAIPAQPNPADHYVQGRNSWGEIGYDGPQPPLGKPHRYVFRLLALDQKLPLPAGLHRAQLLQQVEGHVLAEAQLVGTWRQGN